MSDCQRFVVEITGAGPAEELGDLILRTLIREFDCASFTVNTPITTVVVRQLTEENP